jgi:N-acetylglucosaminyldiphosphoundecaprenol N-acetyl-beta-D-mannosaminyltransferase
MRVAITMLESRESRVAILGVAIDNLTMDQVLDSLEAQIAEGGFHQIATANVDFVIISVRDEELREVLNRCDIVLADGMPLVWASRLLGVRLKERVAGADLVPRLIKLSAQRGYRIFLLGASEESSAGTAAWIRKNFPSVCIAGRHCPRFQPLEEMDHEDILARIEEARPDILMVAFGNPKQEKWLAMHRHRLKVPVCIGVGGSFDFLSGRIRRAPVWMQKSGLEWLYRTIQEPSRLAKRYASNVLGLIRYLPVQMIAIAIQAKRRSQARITNETVGAAKVLRIDGNFTGALLSRFETDARSAIVSGSHLVLDMSATAYIGADALGSLIHLLSTARRRKRELWIAGLHPLLRWVVRAARLDHSIRTAPRVADALRRIEPELVPVTQLGRDFAFCRIGGQLVPIHAQEMPDVYRQVHIMLKQRAMIDPISITSSESQEKDRLIRELIASMPDEMLSREQTKPQGISFLDVQPRSVG